jgi:YebC/PmpR family DNA-binding regulatory protein
MSGHSKWNNIKNRKGAQDIHRAAIFNQISKQIRIAVKQGKSGDPKSNPSLRLAMDKARSANMPNDRIQKAIDTGLGKGKNGSIHEIVYEGFGPAGVAFLAVAQTDNPNRTSGEVKFIFSRNGGALAGPGSAMYLFTRHGDEYTATMPMDVPEENREAVLDLMVELEANDDVEQVFVSANLPEASSDQS